MTGKTTLHILCLYRSPNSSCETDQKQTLIDLIFSQHDQTITNMTTSESLGKSHKVLRFHYTVDNNWKNERPRYLYHSADYDSMKLELQKVDWYEVFYNSSSTECWEKFKEIMNNLISKFVPLQKQTNKKNQIYMDEQTNVIKN